MVEVAQSSTTSMTHLMDLNYDYNFKMQMIMVPLLSPSLGWMRYSIKGVGRFDLFTYYNKY